jgi:hypothetical protein
MISSVPRAPGTFLRRPLRAASILAVGVASACVSEPLGVTPTASPASRGDDGPGAASDCQPWATVYDGPYRYSNNEWGHDKAKGPFDQCLLSRSRDGRTERGWRWSWPGFDASVFAYPEIEFGWKPWTGGKSTDARFPMRVGDVKHLVMRYDVETQATGSYDLAPEIWITTRNPSDDANPGIITTEVMFWMDYAEGARPAGKVVETPALDGVTYELWKEDKIGESANGKGWMLLSFKSPTIRRKGTISIHALLRHLVESRLVRPDEYVASVEFGNEVMGGTGTTWVKRFDLEIE